MYEDRNDFVRAQACYRRVLETAPDHEQAKLNLKDALRAATFFTTKIPKEKTNDWHQLLNVPVTDFELSVRSRNCLPKMGIRTLGRSDARFRASIAVQQELWRNVTD